MGAGSQPKPVMIQKGMNAHKSVQANKIILLNNLKKKHPQQEDGELLRGVARRPPFVLKGDTAADIRKGLSHSGVEGVAGCSPERMVGRTVLFLCPKMKGCCLGEGASTSHSF